MSNRGIFPRKDADFDTYLENAAPYITTHAPRLLVGPGNLIALSDLKTIWDDRYPKSINPNTSTKTIRDVKTQTRKDIETLLRSIYDDIPASLLTNDDRDTLNLQERDTTPTARAKITTAPGVLLKPLQGSTIQAECRVESDSSRPSRHPQSDAIGYRWEEAVPPPTVGDDGSVIPSPPAESGSGISSKAKFTFTVPGALAGRTVSVQCRWLNISDSSKNGPWSSPPVSVMVMG